MLKWLTEYPGSKGADVSGDIGQFRHGSQDGGADFFCANFVRA